MTTDRGRNDGLDLLRASAAGLVFATHLWHKADATYLGPIAQGGHIGVWIFFALSGYLLYRPFVEGTVDLRRYAVSRVARLAPAYYLAAFAVALSGLEPGMVADPWPTLTVTINTFPTEPYGLRVFGQAWTLGIEVAFYLVLPVVAALTRKGLTLLLLVGLSWYVTQQPLGDWWRDQLPVQFWAFGAGMIVARWQGRLRPLARLWPLGLGLLVLGIFRAAEWHRGDTEVVVGSALLILAAVTYRPRIPWARWPADISYSIYLWHVLVIYALAGLSGPVHTIATVIVVCIIASASWFLLERPVLAWVRARNDQRRAGARARSADSPSATVAPAL